MVAVVQIIGSIHQAPVVPILYYNNNRYYLHRIYLYIYKLSWKPSFSQKHNFSFRSKTHSISQGVLELRSNIKINTKNT